MGWQDTVDLWMCRLAGLPVSESWDRPPGPLTPRQIAVTGLCVIASIFLAIVRTIRLIQRENSDAVTTYTSLSKLVFPLATAIATWNMAVGDRSAPKRLAVRRNCLREAMIQHGLRVAATNACRTVSTLLLVTTLLFICNDYVRDVMVNLSQLRSDELDSNRSLLDILVLMQNQLLFWTIMRWSASQPLAELGIVQDVICELAANFPDPDPEDEPAPGVEPEDGLDQPRAPLTVHRCRLLIEVCDQANKLRLESNRWLHVPSCLMMFSTAWHIPLLIRVITSSTRFVSPAYFSIGSIVVLAPLFCAQLVKHRRENLVHMAARRADRTADPALRRALNKLKIHAMEAFPDSPCVLVNFDLSFLPVLLNVILLTFTTFFQQESN